jgi:transcriptional regulator with XRE-family HTH domain
MKKNRKSSRFVPSIEKKKEVHLELDTIGKRLRNARLDKGLSQVDLAKKVKSFPQVIGDYERSRRGSLRPDIMLLNRICKELEISIDHLFLGIEEGKTKKKVSK